MQKKFLFFHISSLFVLIVGLALIIKVSSLYCPPDAMCGYGEFKSAGSIIGAILSVLGFEGAVYSLIKLVKSK